MEITLSEDQNITIAALSGDIDGRTAPDAQSQITPKITDGVRLLLDMSAVPYMSSAGLRMLLLIYRQITAKQGHVVLAGLNDEIKDTMEATGFLDHFTTVATVDEAKAALGSPNS